MHQPLMSLRRFGAFLRSNAAASARDWQSQSPPARKCPFIPSWTLIDVPTTGSILIYSHFVQTVLTSRLRLSPPSQFWFLRCTSKCQERPVHQGTCIFLRSSYALSYLNSVNL